MRGRLSVIILAFCCWVSSSFAQRSISELQTELARQSYSLRIPETPDSEDQAHEMVSTFIKGSDEWLNTIRSADSDVDLLQSIDAFFSELSIFSSGLDLVMLFHADMALRAACEREIERLNSWFLREVLSDAEIQKKLNKIKRPKSTLSTEDYALYTSFQSHFGFMADSEEGDESRQALQNISRSIERLENEFNRNADSSQKGLRFTAEDLEGLPDHFLKQVQNASGEYVVYPGVWWQYALVSQTARRSSTRLAMERGRFQIAVNSNPPLMEALVELRHRLALEIGFDSWLQHQLHELSLDSESKALQFLESVNEANSSEFENEKEIVRRQKARALHRKDVEVYSHDYRYYLGIEAKERTGVDLSKVDRFFPLDKVMEGMLARAERVFSLKFERLSNSGLWANDLLVFHVSDRESGNSLGLLIYDLYPRDGKDGWFFNTNLSPGRNISDGGRQLPVTLVSGNFPPPTATRPSQLFYEDIETLLHETGHALHNLLSRTSSGTLFGFNSAEDFTETPSKFLETWAGDPQFLSSASRDYETGRMLSTDEAQKIIEAASIGKAHERQALIARSLFDLRLHSVYTLDGTMAEVHQKVLEEYFYPSPAHSLPLASFTHITSGYDGLMWIYLMGEVLGHKISTRFLNTRDGYESQKIARQLVDTMLSRGGTLPTKRMARNFLHRSFDPCKAVFEMLPPAN